MMWNRTGIQFDKSLGVMTIFITGSSRGLGFQLGRLFESCGGVVLYHRRSVHLALKYSNHRPARKTN